MLGIDVGRSRAARDLHGVEERPLRRRGELGGRPVHGLGGFGQRCLGGCGDIARLDAGALERGLDLFIGRQRVQQVQLVHLGLPASERVGASGLDHRARARAQQTPDVDGARALRALTLQVAREELVEGTGGVGHVTLLVKRDASRLMITDLSRVLSS